MPLFLPPRHLPRRWRLFALLAALAGGSSCSQQELDLAPIQAYLMAGQSNMAGRGEVGPEDAAVSARILALDSTGRFVPKTQPNLRWQGLLAGLDCGSSFAAALLPHLDVSDRVGLVQCAVGNTRLQEWLDDSLRSVPLYTNLLQRARAAEAGGGRLQGLLWLQGESDAEDSADAARYGARLQDLIQNLRRDLARPALPVYIGLLPAWNRTARYRNAVNEGIRAVARTLPAVYCFGTDDLPPKADSLHYNAAGQRQLGQRFAVAVAEH